MKRRALAARRKLAGLSQEKFAELLEVDRSTVVRWESGATQPYPRLQQRIAEVLGLTSSDLDALLGGASSKQHPASFESEGWLPSLGRRDRPDQHSEKSKDYSDPDVLANVLDGLHHWSEVDNKDGALSILDDVEGQARDLLNYLRQSDAANSTDSFSARVFYVAARCAEFTGWLHQDLGALDVALHWSNTALDLASQAGDSYLIPYLWMRKSNIMSDARFPALSFAYAESGGNGDDTLSPKMQSVILRQKAHAFALAGDRSATEETLEQAFTFAQLDDFSDDELAAYCTEEFVEMEAANCRIELGRYDTALPTLERAVERWDVNFSRDLSLGLARLATLHAGAGDVKNAASSAQRSLEIIAGSGSRRAIDQLQRSVALMPACAEADELHNDLQAVRNAALLQ